MRPCPPPQAQAVPGFPPALDGAPEAGASAGIFGFPAFTVPLPDFPAFAPLSNPGFQLGTDSVQFEHASGALRYVGAQPRRFHVVATVSGTVSPEDGRTLIITILRNGLAANLTTISSASLADPNSLTVSDYVLLAPGDVLQIGVSSGGAPGEVLNVGAAVLSAAA
jgi:hypothetical protein